VEIQFDPDEITYHELLQVFIATHDPTTLNRQGADRGTRYRSIILYTDETQRDQAEGFIKDLRDRNCYKSPIVTEVQPLEKFYEAEADHKDYYLENPGSMYCQMVITPKVKKFRQEFAERLQGS
jgi:peptide-methionine (S)-S-oxide reductase